MDMIQAHEKGNRSFFLEYFNIKLSEVRRTITKLVQKRRKEGDDMSLRAKM